ncbi:MAG TPA: hypothetical protein VF303_04620 [Candidatus Nanoarchaeia archaeon]
MVCPVCGYTATRVSNTYWCPNDRIFLGHNIAVESQTQPFEEPIYQEFKKGTAASKFFNYLVWSIMAGLYIVVIILVVWNYLTGGFGDTSSIFE